ncbi:MAG: hypothetical protein Q8L69_02360 [Gallionellaceae bacterium]|nr:hypothetical protein [Gallionellaceae bacterium]
MVFNPDIHHRRSIRLRGYDYSQAGMYFVTICTQGRLCLFGDVVDGAMQLNDAGLMIERWYSDLKNKFPDIECGEFVCMPNHIHAIVVNVGADLRVRPDDLRVRPDDLRVRPDLPAQTVQTGQTHTKAGQTHGSAPTGVGTSLSGVVQWFKTMSTNEYIRGVKQNGWQPFPAKLWQRNYYEHIIRDEDSYLKIAEYIQTNPQGWQMDTYHV